MKAEAQRIAIAEFCKWEVRHGGRYCHIPNCDNEMIAHLIDPLNDLNAMREAEQALDGTAKHRYLFRLIEATNTSICDCLTADKFKFVTATASQRAEAFLKTIGKWEDS